MPGVNFQLLREQIAMRDVLGLLQFEPRVLRGDQWRGPCPLHGSRNPQSRSFSVNVRSTFTIPWRAQAVIACAAIFKPHLSFR